VEEKAYEATEAQEETAKKVKSVMAWIEN